MSDINIFRNTNVNVIVQGISGTKVSGLTALVQEVLMQILTPIGTYPGDSTRGSNIPKWLKQGYNIQTLTVFNNLVTTELSAMQTKIKKDQLGHVLDPKRLLYSLTLKQSSFSDIPGGISAVLIVNVRNVAGQTVTTTIPA